MQKPDAALQAVLQKAARDPAFRQALVDDPDTTLPAEGIALPEGVTIKVVEDTPTLAHLVLPPAGKVLSDSALGEVAGGRPASLPYGPGGAPRY